MNEMRVPEPEQVAATPPPSRPADPLRRWTVVILVFCVMLFGWTLIADRLTPYTSDVSVRTFVVRTVPEVSGKVIEVGVRDNQIVRTGDLLYRIDPTSFRIAVERAEAKLAAAGQAMAPPPQRWMRPRRNWWRRSRSEATSASRRRASSSSCA